MRTGFRTFIAGSLLFFLTSCMYMSSEYQDPQVSPDSFKGGIVILPFSDYTPYNSYSSYWRRSDVLQDTLKENFLKKGLISARRTDVNEYVIGRRIIVEEASRSSISPRTEYIRREMDAGWNEQMQKEFEKALLNNISNNPQYRVEDPFTGGIEALDRGMIRELGSAFEAKYVIRGRVMAFSFRQEGFFQPNRFESLSFFLPLERKVVFGVSDPDTYEILDQGGAGVQREMSITKESLPLEVGGYQKRPILRMTIIIHDGSTGDIIYKNTLDVLSHKLISTSNTAERAIIGEDFDRALRKGTKDILLDFFRRLDAGWYD